MNKSNFGNSFIQLVLGRTYTLIAQYNMNMRQAYQDYIPTEIRTNVDTKTT